VIIQEHGGAIAIESRPQAGTTVTCRLPAYRGERHRVSHESPDRGAAGRD
jgi:light-regulated signal transduction histidine kinase (bacteriophytochrome)